VPVRSSSRAAGSFADTNARARRASHGTFLRTRPRERALHGMSLISRQNRRRPVCHHAGRARRKLTGLSCVGLRPPRDARAFDPQATAAGRPSSALETRPTRSPRATEPRRGARARACSLPDCACRGATYGLIFPDSLRPPAGQLSCLQTLRTRLIRGRLPSEVCGGDRSPAGVRKPSPASRGVPPGAESSPKTWCNSSACSSAAQARVSSRVSSLSLSSFSS
jgi:hypothetical protein